MKKKRECKIIQDLLPNYVENLTNEETNKFIDEHLTDCEDCKKVLESMKKEIKVGNEKPDGREVKFMKKYKRKIKILGGIILLAVIIYLAFVIRNFVIFSSLDSKKNKNWNSDNYHVTRHYYNGDRLNIYDIKYKDGKYLSENISLSLDGITKLIEYSDGNITNMYFESEYGKIAKLNVETSIPPYVDETLLNTLFNRIMLSVIFNVKEEKCNGLNCYYIFGEGYKEYIDKDTGLCVRRADVITKNDSGTFNNLVDHQYEFGTVTDEDLVPPDLSEYEIK